MSELIVQDRWPLLALLLGVLATFLLIEVYGAIKRC